MPRTILKSRRSRTSCSLIALATVLAVGASPAAAQSFQGSGLFVNPAHGTIDQSVAGQTTVNLNSGVTQSVINWTPTDSAPTGGNIIFQPQGTTATFAGQTNFAVLNNINAPIGRAIEMRGSIVSLVGTAQQGSVYFYAPGGFVFTSTSSFNVGSLVVSALPIDTAGSTFITGFGTTNSVTFGQALNPAASIVMNGAVSANSPPPLGFPVGSSSSYVAMIAPKIVHNGTITVNGSAALVAAEAATINFSPDGLFDIQVTVGSTSSSGVEVYGDITGPAPVDSTDKQGIYLVAIPKNQAMTMVIGNGADLGFTLANSALDDNGVIVLSAGHDIVDGAIGGRSAGHGASAEGNFGFTGAHATNNLIGEATGYANLYSVAPNLTTTFDNDVTIHANEHVWMNAASAGSSLTVGGDLSLSASRTGAAGQSVTAGDVQLYALNGGTVSVAGTISLNADATGGGASSGAAGSGTGGTVSIFANDGSTLTLSNMTISAVGTGGSGLAPGAHAGHGTGGTISMSASNGGAIVMNSPLLFDAQGYGGNATGTGIAGNGSGGTARIFVGTNANMTFNGNVTLDTDGFGGSSDIGTGGTGTGGSSRLTRVENSSGGLMTFNGNVALSADGFGGFSNSGNGGLGTGGSAYMFSAANHYVVAGNANIHATGVGGGSELGGGGVGFGGLAEIESTGSEVDISGTVTLDSSGIGGSGEAGGDGFGGTSSIRSTFDVALPGNVYIYADGVGGDSWNGNGGSGFGGTVDVQADGGVLSIGSLYAQADGDGGYADSGFRSGDGQGGSIDIRALGGGDLSIANGLTAYADGTGGETLWLGVDGGDGIGGFIQVAAAGAGSTLNVGGYSYLSATGQAGFAGECSICGGLGGQGLGGAIYASASGAGAVLTFASVEAQADGYGGMGVDAAGGYGEGGFVQFSASADGNLTVTEDLYASANGFGGDQTEGGYGADGDRIAGDGVGGEVQILTFGSGNPRIAIAGSAEIEADGFGGDVYSNFFLFGQEFSVIGQAEPSGTASAHGVIRGGNGTGGRAGIYGNSGKFSDDDNPDNDGGIYIGGNASVSADGFGGDTGNGYGGGLGGTGGDGLGGRTRVVANDGTIRISGNLEMDATATGGSGTNGGHAIAVTTPLTNEGAEPAAFLWAGTATSELQVDGLTDIDVSATGGTGFEGNGGNASGGEIDIVSQLGNVTLGDVIGNAQAYGGGGGNGGSGGDATGGNVDVAWSLSGGALTGTIAIDSLDLSASAYGGDGGAGVDANSGGTGGSGGSGTGGNLFVVASAAGGTLNIGAATLAADGVGGAGGSGGSGGGGAGGNGGAGGAGAGGSVFVGSISSNLNPGSGGSATFTTLSGSANAVGGAGGNGGEGGGGSGTGGDGGDASAGQASFLVRGIPVTVDTVNLFANATGGNGGFGSIDGNGGNAASGFISVESKDRFDHPTQRGSLTAGTINGTAIAQGGSGATDGTSTVRGGSYFRVLNGDANIGSVNFTFAGDAYDGTQGPNYIQAQDGTATIGSFSYDTTGHLAVYTTSTGTLDIGTLTLTAGNFIDHPTLVGPASPGTIFADNVFISTGGDFVADANWDVTNTFVVDAPGLIRLDHVVDDNGIDFSAGGTISIGTIDAGTYVDLLAGGTIATDDIVAGTTVRLESTAGAISFPTIDAGGNVTLLAGTSVSGVDVTSGGNVLARSFGGDLNFANLESDGSMQLYSSEDILLSGDIDAGTSLTSLAAGLFDGNEIDAGTFIDIGTGGGISLGNLAAGDYIDLRSGGPISILNAISGETISFATQGSLTALNLTAGDSVLGQAMGAITIGTVSAGIVNPSSAVDAEYRVRFASNGNIGTGAVAAAGDIGFSTAGNLVTGNLNAGAGIMALVGGNISLPTVSAGDYVFLADDSMAALGGDFETFDRSAVLAAAPVLTGGAINISGPLTAGSFVTAAAGTNLSFTSLNAGSNVGLQAGNNITGNSITGGGSISLHAIAGDISLGSATSSFASIMMEAGDDIGLTGNLLADGDILLTADGDIAMNNATSGFFRADALGGTFTANNITSDADIRIFADGGVTAGNLSAGLPAGESSKALRIDTNGSVVVGNMVALGGIDVTADGSVTGLDVTTGDVLITEANGAITYGNISAGLVNPQPASEPASVVLDSATSITVGNINAAGTVGFVTNGTLTAGNVTAGADLLGLVHGNIATGNITADGRVLLADSAMFTGAGGAVGNFGDDEIDIDSIFAATPVRTNGSITIGNVLAGGFTAAAGTSLTTGFIDTGSEIGLGATGAITTGNLFAGDFVLANGGSITTGSIDANSVEMASTGGSITIAGDVTAAGLVELDAFDNIVADNITAGTIDLAAGGSITTDNLTTQQPVLPAAANTIQAIVPDEEGNITLIAGGDILTGNISAAQNILLATPGMITGQTVNAGGMFMALAHGDMSFGDATAGVVFLADYAMLSLGGGGDFSASCVGNCGTLGADGVVIAPPSGLTYFYVTTDGGVSGVGQLPGEGGTNGSLYTTAAFSAAAGDDLEFWFNYVTSDGSGFADYSWAALLTADLDPVAILFTARTQPTGTIVPGQDLPGVEATLNPSTVPIIAGAPQWSPLGSSSGTCYNAGCGYTGWVSSTYEIATAGTYVLAFGVSNWSDTAYQSGMAFSGITIGGVPVQSAPIRTGGSITIGNVVTGSFTAAAGTDLTTGIINSTGQISLGANGAINTANLFAGSFLHADGGSVTTGNINAGSVDMTSTNGNITTGNIVASGDVDLDASGNLTAQAITADDIEARATGMATVNGAWSAGNVQLTSNDIDITANGSIDAANLLTLVSTNATQALIGDGLTGSGYALSDAEFGRLQGGSVHILARGDASAAQDMLIGNLTVTGPGAGGTIDSSEGILVFGVGDAASESVNGVIRVNGNVAATGFGTNNAIEFYADRFELDAATGSVSILSSGSTLGGVLGIYADQIHVASGSILDQLAANPTYTNYQQDLNKPAAVQRPEGVLRAHTLWIESDNLQSVLVQNTGSSAVPAGFLVHEAYINEDSEVAGPPGSINLVVNGQVVTEIGTLTGVAARDALVDEETDTTPFTANSTINGCPLTGQCIIMPPPPPPTSNLVQNQIDLIGRNPIGESQFDDNQEGEEGSSNPISPPQPLFDTRPLVPSGDVNDPVSGTGNPALTGGEAQCEEEEDGTCPAPANGDEQ